MTGCGFEVLGLGFRVSQFGVSGSVFCCSAFRGSGFGVRKMFGVSGSGFKVSRFSISTFRVWGAGFRVFRVSRFRVRGLQCSGFWVRVRGFAVQLLVF